MHLVCYLPITLIRLLFCSTFLLTLAICNCFLYLYTCIIASMSLVGDRDIKRLKVECSNRSNGCQFVGELGQHDAICDFSLLPCPNKCTDQQNKITTVMKKDMEKHTMECPKRQYECPHCKETGEYNERTTKHLEECASIIEDVCPNEGCTEKLLHCDLPKHRQECPRELVMCKYAYLGCDVTLPREEMTEHHKDNQPHANLSMLKHTSRYYCVDNFNEKKRDYPVKNFVFHFRENDGDSEEIVTTLTAYLNQKDEKNKHTISFSVFDIDYRSRCSYSLPPWKPITIELLNQLEDNNHHCCRLPLVDGARNDKIIAHSVLGYNPTTNCQYLKDDKLYFRVSITL